MSLCKRILSNYYLASLKRNFLISILDITATLHMVCHDMLSYITQKCIIGFDLILFDLLCLTPLSAIFQLYDGDQF